MKVNQILLVCLSLILAASVIAEPPKAPDFPKGISLTIDRHPGWLGESEEGGDRVFAARSGTRVRCRHIPVGRSQDYNGTLPYPMGFMAKVSDKDGVVLTRTATFGDWWTSYFDESGCRCPEMPGDRITLKPREKVVRIVPLAVVLRGMDNLRGGLKAGDYASS